MNRKKGYTIFAVLWVLWIVAMYYLCLPAINIHARGFWSFLLIVVILPPSIALAIGQSVINFKNRRIQVEKGLVGKSLKVLLGLFVVILVGLGLNAIFSSEFFHAKRYASILNIQEKGDGKWTKKKEENRFIC